MPPRTRPTSPRARRTTTGTAARPAGSALGALAVATTLMTLTACTEGSAGAANTAPAASDASSSSGASSPSGAPGASGSATVAVSGSAAPAASTTSAATSVTSAAPSVSGAAASTPAAGRPQLILQVDGLGVATGGSIRQLPFGTAAATVSTALTTTLGSPRTTRQPECGQGARTQLDRQGFSVLIDGTRFVGWTDDGAGGRHLTTADGLGVGSTLAQVRGRLAGVQVVTDTLGPEFSSDGGLSGLLSGTSASAKVTTLYAGETCFFR